VFRPQLRPAPDQVEVIIGPRATFSGQLRCDGSIRLDGTIEGGLVETPANVLITDTGRIMADIQARTVSIAGAFKGTITADRVELLEGGRLWGTINVRSFLLDEGAHFQGELNMQTEEAPEPVLMERPVAGAQIPIDRVAAVVTADAAVGRGSSGLAGN
jgi:cytoskeletal protein CcmA (bactofilin family)